MTKPIVRQKDLRDALEYLAGRWLRRARRAVRRKHPKLADELFLDLVQMTGGVVIVMLARFLERLLRSLGFRKSRLGIEDETVEETPERGRP